jgi:hypothetical protein
VLKADGHKTDFDSKPGGQLVGTRLEQGVRVAIFGVVACRVVDAAFDAKIPNLLLGVLLG